MKQDKRSYTFVFAPTSNFPLRKFNVYHKALYAVMGFAIIGLLTFIWLMYEATQYGFVKLQNYNLKRHNRELKEENQRAKSEYDQLQSRLAVLDTNQRKVAEVLGVSRNPDFNKDIGRGGPDGDTKLKDIEEKTAALENQMRYIKDVFDRNQIKLASTPTGWPVRGYITDGFGTRRNPFDGVGYEPHAGLDIATNYGTPIETTADGTVIFAGAFGGYGNVVVIDHGYGITTRYGHMSQINVRMGQYVTRGKTIGAVGSTGRSTGPHCHYEVRLHDRAVNPLSYISISK
ncbi:MAG TPA: peptidoglycan DD-metalloendopeptidase family protein [Blastocatellia bacterium]|nr:peptidoglycan DD-metalloendopeptidase family protein [Blastocatellia bacterium]